MIDYVPRAKSIIDGKIGWVFSYFKGISNGRT